MTANAPALTINDVDLLFRFCNQLRKHLNRELDTTHNLTYDELQILWHIASNEGERRPSTATGLDELLALSKKSKQHVAKLVSAKLLEVDDSSHGYDHRSKQLRPSEKGKIKITQLLLDWPHIAATIFSGLDAQRLRQLSDVLRELGEAPDDLRRRFDDP